MPASALIPMSDVDSLGMAIARLRYDTILRLKVTQHYAIYSLHFPGDFSVRLILLV